MDIEAIKKDLNRVTAEEKAALKAAFFADWKAEEKAAEEKAKADRKVSQELAAKALAERDAKMASFTHVVHDAIKATLARPEVIKARADIKALLGDDYKGLTAVSPADAEDLVSVYYTASTRLTSNKPKKESNGDGGNGNGRKCQEIYGIGLAAAFDKFANAQDVAKRVGIESNPLTTEASKGSAVHHLKWTVVDRAVAQGLLKPL